MPEALKKALSIPEQINFIKSLPVIIDNESTANKFLRNISLCHLKAYWLAAPRNNKYFSEIIKLYEFDRRLKLLFLDALADIELSIRTAWIYALTDSRQNYDALSYCENQNLYQNPERWQKLRQDMKEAYDKNSKRLPYMQKYRTASARPPIWKMAELISFGLLSRLIAELNHKTPIAKNYYLEDYNFITILHLIVKICNICSHHEPLWNYKDKKYPKLNKSNRAAILKESLPDAKNCVDLYTISCFCVFLLNNIDSAQ